MYELTVICDFAAAHNLRGYEGECENLHGHNWKVEVTVESKRLNKIGLAMDFKVLKKILDGILGKLDHKYLNEIPSFDKENPSSENLARYIFKQFKTALSNPPLPVAMLRSNGSPAPLQKGGKGGLKVAKVKVWESESACAAYYE
ncbi:MAG: 6-carboxytetrahydropterin synthase QueD [Deltaproteobacteria bacterium]|nr:6-carboxytetrahydropterin synthase QueD [Deltaproteobacteria bacterium]